MSGTLNLQGVPALVIPNSAGTATLNGTAAVTVSAPMTDANTLIFLTTQSPAGTPGTPYVATVTPGAGFTVKSTSSGDTSQVAWVLIDT